MLMLRKSIQAFLVLTGSLISQARAEAPRPNIVYIYADDLGWGYLKANGQSHIKTPNLDALADAGVNFTRGYGCTVCSPARSSQQTGFHQGHTWTDRNDPDSSKAIRSDDVTIGDTLKSAGYRTAYFGKWGYGADKTINNPAINNPQTLPINQGYDVVLAELHHVRAHTFFQPTLWRSNTDDQTPTTALVPNSIANDPSYPDYPAYQNDASYPSPAYCDDSYAFAALDFVRDEALDTSKPFFCLLAFQIPHTPLGEITSLPKWFDQYNDVDTSNWAQESKEFAAMVTRMDAHIGNLIQALKDPNNDGDTSDSVLSNTLIVFASDNGGQSSGEAGQPLNQFDGNANLRGAKGNIFEGAIRVPMLMSWPGHLPAGTTSSQVIDVTDMLPTFCELAGVTTPVGIDGVSLAPTLTQNGHQRPRDFLIHEAGNQASIIQGRYKLVKNGGYALYDLEADPSESTNILGTGVDSDRALSDVLTTLLLGERVTEPDSFANTYHHWTGADGASLSDAAHWSDYDYSNNGTSYLSDSGAPQLSWIARLRNTSPQDLSAVADANIATLGIEIGGDSHSMNVAVGAHTLTGRNEIRLANHASVTLEGGTLDSLRWVDLLPGASLTGSGTITSSLYHSGQLISSKVSGGTSPGNGQELISNGGFELGSVTGDGDYSYASLSNWSTDGASTNNDAAKPNNARSGNFRGLIQGHSSDWNLTQDTGHTIVNGDSYALSFWHRGFSGWATGEQARVSLYYFDSQNNKVELFGDTFALTFGSWVQATYTIAAINDANAIGKNLHISLSPTSGATGYASFDDVSLSRTGDPVALPDSRKLSIHSDYRASSTAQTTLKLAGNTTAGFDYSQIEVAGSAHVAGSLSVELEEGFSPAIGDRFTVLTATACSGRYTHTQDIIIAGEHHFKIEYSPAAIVLEKIAVTSKGTPHSWLDSHGIQGNDYETFDLVDSDGDGMPNWKEFIAGTNPTSASSVSGTLLTPTRNPDGHSLSWEMKADRDYFLESSSDLRVFTIHDGPFSGADPSFSYTLPKGADPHRFYRVRIERK